MDALAQVASSQREAINESQKVASIDDRINAYLALNNNTNALPSNSVLISDSPNEPPVELTNCFGLPYNDHTYGAPFPKLKEESNNLTVLADSINSISYINTTEKCAVKSIAKRHENDESITRCICGFNHDDGYMICCDKCSAWQHVDCMQLDKKNIPDEYLCDSCLPRTLNKYRAVQLQKKRILLLDSVISPVDSTTETEDETQASIHTGLDELADVALMNGETNKIVKGKKRIKKRLKKMSKDDLEISLMRGNSLKKHVKYNKKIANKTKKFEKHKNTIKKIPKSKISKYKIQQDTYEEATVNIYNNETKHFDYPDSDDLSILKSMNISGPLCRVSIVNDNLKGLNLVRSVRCNEIVIEYRGKVMYEKTYNLLPAKERKSGYALYYKFNGISLCINTSSFANDARFIRRSCTPNSKIIHKLENGCIRFFIYASEIIENTTELTIPFDHKSFETKCACNSAYCLVKKIVVTPTRKTRNQSLSENKTFVTPKKHKEIKAAKSPDDQQAIDALLTLANAVITPKLCIDDIIQVSEDNIKISSNVSNEAIIDTTLIKEEKINKKVVKDEPIIEKEIVNVDNTIKIKDDKPSQDSIPLNDIKPEKSNKSSQESNSTKSVQILSPPLLPSSIRLRRSRLSSELISNKRPSSEILSSSAEDNSDSERVEEHKLTREERKLQAIVKQFEQMENKEHKNKSTSRTSSRKASKDVIEPIEEFKPDSKTRHKKHKENRRRKNRRQSTNSTSSITPVASDNEIKTDKKENDIVKKEVVNEWLSSENINKEILTLNNTSVGSAKKRWLRQAMIEHQDLTHDHKSNGALSGNVELFIAPIKKRRINSEKQIQPISICEMHLPETPPSTDDNKPIHDDIDLNSDNDEVKTTIINTPIIQSNISNLPMPITIPKPIEPIKKKVSLAEYRKRIKLPSSSTTTLTSAIKTTYNKSHIKNNPLENALNLSSISIRADIEFDHISGDTDHENLQYYKAYNQYPDHRYQERAWQQHLSQRRLSTSASNSSYQSERPPC